MATKRRPLPVICTRNYRAEPPGRGIASPRIDAVTRSWNHPLVRVIKRPAFACRFPRIPREFHHPVTARDQLPEVSEVRT